MISFVAVLFYALTVLGIFILRRKQPLVERPYKAFAYPLLPAIYIVLAIVFCAALVIQEPQYSIFGSIIVLLGIPLYYIALSRKKA
jgi:APA family basic amino acid/polyamine antiporter